MSNTILIFTGADGWHITVAASGSAREIKVSVARQAAPDSIADAVANAVIQAGVRGTPAMLVIPSTACLAARISTEGLPPKSQRSAMTFRLEAKLPLAAEEVAVDFIPDAQATAALGIATEAAPIKPLIEALENHDLVIQSICPAIFLELQDFQVSRTEVPFDAFLKADDSQVDLLLLQAGKPTHWYLLPKSAADIKLHLDPFMAQANPLRLVCSGLNQAAIESLQLGNHVKVVCMIEASPKTVTGSGILMRRLPPMIDLRSGPLAPADALRPIRRSLTWAAVAAVALIFACIAGVCWRAIGYRQLAANYDQQQQALFKKILPGRPIPMNIKARLVSEERGLTGTGMIPAAIAPQPSAIVLLHDVLLALPSELRFRLQELRLGDGRIYLDGEARSHAEADAIAAALRRTPGFQIDSPQTEQSADRTVRFVINGLKTSSPARRLDAPKPTALSGGLP